MKEPKTYYRICRLIPGAGYEYDGDGEFDTYEEAAAELEFLRKLCRKEKYKIIEQSGVVIYRRANK